MKILKVVGLSKSYPKFQLCDVSFEMKAGRIMGFIGRNGAGKTTTLKAILNIVHADAGCVECFGLDSKTHEFEMKQRIGYAGGIVEYYKKKKISEILDVTKRFYANWDDNLCNKYMDIFSLDVEKTPAELSQGMKVKLNLVIAMSHKAGLLILDEPTSGLDPVSREELLDVFKILKSRGVSILFSTHIISDLEKCADDITYIKEGRIVYSGELAHFTKGRNLEDVIIEYEKEKYYEKFDL